MAQYKVPQDVEADDKLLGPFSFRQFVYLVIAVGLCFVAFLFFQIFPLLVIIPIPFILFLGALALPLKKDQPMETYLSALIDFYLKPQKRIWMPGQPDTAITITAPKNIEESRTKDLSQEEAGRRLSFLANIVDTEGYAIKDTNSNLRDDIASEAASAQDIFDTNNNYTLEHSLEQSALNRRNQIIAQMQSGFNATPTATTAPAQPQATPNYQAYQTPAQASRMQYPTQSYQTPTAPTPTMQAYATTPYATTPQPAAAPQPTITPQPTVTPQPMATPQASYQPVAAQPYAAAQPFAPTQPIIQPPAPTQPAPTIAPPDISASSATIQPDMEEIHEALAEEEPEETPIEEEPRPSYLPPAEDEAPREEPAESTAAEEVEETPVEEPAAETETEIEPEPETEPIEETSDTTEENTNNNSQSDDEVYISLHH